MSAEAPQMRAERLKKSRFCFRSISTRLRRHFEGDNGSFSMEQRVNLKFLVKLGKTFTEAYAMLKEVYGNECLSRTQVFEWFNEGRETTEDNPCPGRPSTSKTNENIEKSGKSVKKSAKIVV
ncbi:hypothetical protein NQ318_021436 [Aromia moschata]|uniref:Mos1 transposase HTH domain-containing protein n=1 Tax=Aromia moschata TaxID=1265417 RepID=A0AAV8ZCK3_9CUCU|nr:hypothetical protein NQ318_021436 [Aromia moschata]